MIWVILQPSLKADRLLISHSQQILTLLFLINRRNRRETMIITAASGWNKAPAGLVAFQATIGMPVPSYLIQIVTSRIFHSWKVLLEKDIWLIFLKGLSYQAQAYQSLSWALFHLHLLQAQVRKMHTYMILISLTYRIDILSLMYLPWVILRLLISYMLLLHHTYSSRQRW